MAKSLTGFKYTKKYKDILPLPDKTVVDAMLEDMVYLWDDEYWFAVYREANMVLYSHNIPDEKGEPAALEYVAQCIELLREYGGCPIAPDYSGFLEWLLQ